MAISFLDAEWLDIAQKLKRLTDKGALTWEKGLDTFDLEDVFIVKTPSGSSFVLASADSDGRPHTSLP